MPSRKGPLRADKLKHLSIDKLQRGRLQPRKAMDGRGLRRLAESIRMEGVLQPLLVRKVRRGRYEIVAGERRWHAAKIAGLSKVPVIVRDVSDRGALAIALVENLRREDLNTIDQALAVRRLVEEFSMTHQEVAETIGRSRASVTNLLRLLLLPDEVKAMLVAGRLDMGHARALLPMPREQQLAAAELAAGGKVSVRDVERLAKQPDAVTPVDEPVPDPAEPQWLRSSLEQRLGKQVGLRRDKRGRWRLNIAFEDVEELRRALKQIDAAVESLEQLEREQTPAPDLGLQDSSEQLA